MAKFRWRDGSGTMTLRYITEDMDRHGNVRLYVRRPGQPKIRLRETPGTDAFLAEYRAALAGMPAKPAADSTRGPVTARPGTVRWLLEQYYASAEFRQLDPATRRIRRSALDALCAERVGTRKLPFGDGPLQQLEPRHVIALRDAKAETPVAANNRVRFLNTVFNWAMGPVQLVSRNPCAKIPKLRPARPDGHLPWGPEQCAAFEARHPVGTQARLAYAILRYTGLRRSDAVRLGRQHVRDGRIRIALAKGARHAPKTVEIPVTPELQLVLDAAPATGLTYLMTRQGKPYSTAGFGNAMRDWCDEAGLKGYSAHGLRKTVATELAEAGASELELMATHGWSNPSQARVYTSRASRGRLADNAFARLADRQGEQKQDTTVPPFSEVRKSGTKGAKNAK